MTDLSTQGVTIPAASQESNFLEALGSDIYQFLVPLRNGSSHQFVILPYEIQVGIQGKLQFDKSPGEGLKAQTISLSFDAEGRMRGTPSAYLYMSYYFTMRKDYERALIYLKKAKAAPAQSEQELKAFRQVASLWNGCLHHSLTSLSCQLKAQLAIREMIRTQFSQPVYGKDHEKEYFENNTHVTALYNEYREKIKENGALQEEAFNLKEEDKFELERIQWASFDDWLIKQKSRQTSDSPLVKVESGALLSTRIELSTTNNFSEAHLLTCLIAASNLDRP